MTGEIEKEKLKCPIFPRLHLHDTEKGGPKAPPRNKMALYEQQLDVPSPQKFNSAFLPLPPSNAGSLIPSTYQSNGGSHERTMLSPFNNTRAQSHLAVKFPPYSFVDDSSSYSSMSSVQSSNVMKTLSLADKCHSLQLNNNSSNINFSLEKINDVVDFRLPISPPSMLSYFNYSEQNNARDQNSYSRPSCSLQLKPANEKHTKGIDTTEFNSIQPVKSQSQKDQHSSHTGHLDKEKCVSLSLTRDHILEDASMSTYAKKSDSASFKRKYNSLEPESESCSRSKISHLDDAYDKESLSFKMVFRDKETRYNTSVRSGQLSRPPLEGDNKNSNGLDNAMKFCAMKECERLQLGDLDGRRSISEHYKADSAVTFDICLDEVVEILGEIHFRKARNTILNQQRMFAVQVFELHRLVMVQKKLAESPHLLVEVNISVRKENSKNLSQNENLTKRNTKENSFQMFSPPSVGNDTNEKTIPGQSNQRMCPETALESLVPPLAKSSSWGFPPPGSQWLFPVISPTEGLVYKPYTGPYPPPAAFLAQTYDGHGSMNLAEKSEEHPTAAFSIAPSNQGIGFFPSTTPIGQSYIPQYGLPVMPPSLSTSKTEQMHQFLKLQSKFCDNPLSIEDINLNVPQHNTFRILNHMSRTNSVSDLKFPASKESEQRDNSESSPLDVEKGGRVTLFSVAPRREIAEGLPLFPTVPTLHACNENAQTHKSELQTEVIKVVPHNPKSASDSAARIYQSIQKERKQL